MSDPSRDARPQAGGDLVMPALAVAFAIYFFVSVWDLTWEAKANAVMVGAILLALVALQVARTIMRIAAGAAGWGLGSLIEPREVMGTRFALIALSALFIVVIPWLGLTLGLFLLVAALMALLRAGSIRTILATSAIISATAYLLFIALLNSRMPRGPVEALLGSLF